MIRITLEKVMSHLVENMHYEPDTIECFALRRIAEQVVDDMRFIDPDDARGLYFNSIGETLARFLDQYLHIVDVRINFNLWYQQYAELCDDGYDSLGSTFMRRRRESLTFPWCDTEAVEKRYSP